MAAPRDVLIDHDEADGIREYDNPMPAWWLGILWLSIAFAIVFVPYLHFTGWSQIGQYEEEMAAAEAAAEARDAEKKAVAAKQAAENPPVQGSGDGAGQAGQAANAGPSDADIALGAEVYKVRCVACHLADATGGIGPNLTDAEWIHGGTLADIQKTVTVGVPEKGMLAWTPIIGEDAVRQVSAYIHSLGGGQ